MVTRSVGVDRATLRDEGFLPARDERAVKGVDHAFFQGGGGEEGGDGGTFAEDEEGSGNRGERAAGDAHDGELGEVGEEEHGAGDTHAESENLRGSREQRPPETFVVGKVDDSLLLKSAIISCPYVCLFGLP